MRTKKCKHDYGLICEYCFPHYAQKIKQGEQRRTESDE